MNVQPDTNNVKQEPDGERARARPCTRARPCLATSHGATKAGRIEARARPTGAPRRNTTTQRVGCERYKCGKKETIANNNSTSRIRQRNEPLRSRCEEPSVRRTKCTCVCVCVYVCIRMICATSIFIVVFEHAYALTLQQECPTKYGVLR